MKKLLFICIFLLLITLSNIVNADDSKGFVGLYIGSLNSELETSIKFNQFSPYWGNDRSFTEDSSTFGFMLLGGKTSESGRGYLRLSGGNYEECSVNAITLSGDKYFKMNENFNLYFGLSLGYGGLTWKENIEPFNTKDETASSLIAGLQLGGVITSSDHVQFDIGYSYLYSNFETVLEGPGGKVEATMQHLGLLYLGLNYLF